MLYFGGFHQWLNWERCSWAAAVRGAEAVDQVGNLPTVTDPGSPVVAVQDRDLEVEGQAVASTFKRCLSVCLQSLWLI
jgi:hypothetical protein